MTEFTLTRAIDLIETFPGPPLTDEQAARLQKVHGLLVATARNTSDRPATRERPGRMSHGAREAQ